MTQIETSIDDLLCEAKYCGVELWVEGERLCYEFANGSLDDHPELRDQLKDQRDELIEALKSKTQTKTDPKRQLIEQVRSTYAEEIREFPFFGDAIRELEQDIERLSLGEMRRKVKYVNKLAARAKGNRGDGCNTQQDVTTCWYCGQIHPGYYCPVNVGGIE